MSWATIILALLRIVNVIMDTAQQNKWIKAGEDAEIAKASAAILNKTAAAKRVMEEISGLDEDQTDELLRSLEPNGGVSRPGGKGA